MRLTCETFGAPKPIVKWYHGTDELTGNRFNITSDGSLSIKDVKYIDDGDYLCNATNRFGHVHAKGRLIVKEQTRITQVRACFLLSRPKEKKSIINIFLKVWKIIRSTLQC